jgi:hypothetical protein
VDPPPYDPYPNRCPGCEVIEKAQHYVKPDEKGVTVELMPHVEDEDED